MIKKDFKSNSKGFVSLNELKKSPSYPTEDRYRKGPVVVVECIEEIPCNPCETACSKKSIKVGAPITNLPVLVNENSCNGCGSCIIKCPGLAVFVIDKTYSENEATISLPCELLPLPEKGMKITGLDRRGKEICHGKIIKVLSGKAFNHTNVVTITSP